MIIRKCTFVKYFYLFSLIIVILPTVHSKSIGYRTKPKQKGACPKDHFYDQESGGCKKVPCGGTVIHTDQKRRCSGQFLGIKVHPIYHQYYYICKPNSVVFVKCPENQIFNSTISHCQPFIAANTSESISSDCKRTGRFPIYSNCSLFYICDSNGKKLVRKLMECPRNMVYNPKTQRCSCIHKCTPTEVDFDDYFEDYDEKTFPPCKRPGRFRSPTDCSLYYTCSAKTNGKFYQTRYRCPTGTLYDIEKEKCCNRRRVKCELMTIEDLINEYERTHNYNDSDVSEESDEFHPFETTTILPIATTPSDPYTFNNISDTITPVTKASTDFSQYDGTDAEYINPSEYYPEIDEEDNYSLPESTTTAKTDVTSDQVMQSSTSSHDISSFGHTELPEAFISIATTANTTVASNLDSDEDEQIPANIPIISNKTTTSSGRLYDMPLAPLFDESSEEDHISVPESQSHALHVDNNPTTPSLNDKPTEIEDSSESNTDDYPTSSIISSNFGQFTTVSLPSTTEIPMLKTTQTPAETYITNQQTDGGDISTSERAVDIEELEGTTKLDGSTTVGPSKSYGEESTDGTLINTENGITTDHIIAIKTASTGTTFIPEDPHPVENVTEKLFTIDKVVDSLDVTKRPVSRPISDIYTLAIEQTTSNPKETSPSVTGDDEIVTYDQRISINLQSSPSESNTETTNTNKIHPKDFEVFETTASSQQDPSDDSTTENTIAAHISSTISRIDDHLTTERNTIYEKITQSDGFTLVYDPLTTESSTMPDTAEKITHEEQILQLDHSTSTVAPVRSFENSILTEKTDQVSKDYAEILEHKLTTEFPEKRTSSSVVDSTEMPAYPRETLDSTGSTSTELHTTTTSTSTEPTIMQTDKEGTWTQVTSDYDSNSPNVSTINAIDTAKLTSTERNISYNETDLPYNWAHVTFEGAVTSFEKSTTAEPLETTTKATPIEDFILSTIHLSTPAHMTDLPKNTPPIEEKPLNWAVESSSLPPASELDRTTTFPRIDNQITDISTPVESTSHSSSQTEPFMPKEYSEQITSETPDNVEISNDGYTIDSISNETEVSSSTSPTNEWNRIRPSSRAENFSDVQPDKINEDLLTTDQTTPVAAVHLPPKFTELSSEIPIENLSEVTTQKVDETTIGDQFVEDVMLTMSTTSILPSHTDIPTIHTKINLSTVSNPSSTERNVVSTSGEDRNTTKSSIEDPNNKTVYDRSPHQPDVTVKIFDTIPSTTATYTDYTKFPPTETISLETTRTRPFSKSTTQIPTSVPCSQPGSTNSSILHLEDKSVDTLNVHISKPLKLLLHFHPKFNCDECAKGKITGTKGSDKDKEATKTLYLTF